MEINNFCTSYSNAPTIAKKIVYFMFNTLYSLPTHMHSQDKRLPVPQQKLQTETLRGKKIHFQSTISMYCHPPYKPPVSIRSQLVWRPSCVFTACRTNSGTQPPCQLIPLFPSCYGFSSTPNSSSNTQQNFPVKLRLQKVQI